MQFKHKPDRFNVVSSGGGTQSTAIICMIAAGRLPKPDVIVMADTEREASNVIKYQHKYLVPLCRNIGIEYHIIKKSNHTDIDLYQPSNGMILPGYFSEWEGRNKKGQCAGKQPGYCSVRWKKEVVERYLNITYGKNYLTKRGVDMWVGMSVDEPRRIKITTGKWQRRYPLFEKGVTRQMAIQYVQNFGLPEPPRSACWMCPNRHDSGWIWMRENEPDDFLRACKHEEEVQKDHPHLWLTKYGIPLAFAPLKETNKPVQFELVQFCDTGMCFV